MYRSRESTDIEQISRTVHDLVHNLVKDSIVNHELAAPLRQENIANLSEAKIEYFRLFEASYNSQHQFKIVVAKYWLLLAILILALLYQSLLSERPLSVIKLFLALVLSFVAMKCYQRVFTTIPLQSLGTSWALTPAEKKQLSLVTRCEKTRAQAESVGPLRFFRYLVLSSDLNRAMDSRTVNCLELDALNMALFSVKNNVYDCISIACLVSLYLMKHKFTGIIERLIKQGQAADGHSYIVANRIQGTIQDINTWNDDSVIIDPWYGLCLTIKQIKQNPQILLRYPLLNPCDKRVIAKINGSTPPEAYRVYLSKLDELLARKQDLEAGTRQSVSNYCPDLSMLCPRLP